MLLTKVSDMGDNVVVALRRFNRSFTPRIGALDETFLGTGRPLAAARLLFEIGTRHDGRAATVQDLRRRLGVDSGYLSRLLRNLEADGLIELHDDPADGRRRIAALTPAGQSEWDELDRRSDDIATRLIDALTGEQRADLEAALGAAERLLRLSTITIEPADPAGAAADSALGQYMAELDRRFPGGFDAVDDTDAERRSMTPPSGGFLVVDDRGEPLGCGGVRRLDRRTAEIKRMWLHPSLRGLGMGRRLLTGLESLASDLGYDTVVLDTNGSLTEAIAMYERSGYTSIERYNDNPYAERWFRKEL
jgi:DNA-binding MarR family transcriptional regulator/GNAT superfamily N-acetyltransferase